MVKIFEVDSMGKFGLQSLDSARVFWNWVYEKFGGGKEKKDSKVLKIMEFYL